VAELGSLEGRRNREELSVAGLIVGTRPMRSRKGQRWAIFAVQDMTGVQELLVFPEAFARYENLLRTGTPLLLRGRVQLEESGTRLSLLDAKMLEEITERGPTQIRVRLNLPQLNENVLDQLQGLFAGNPGTCAVSFELCSADGSVATLQAQQRVRAAPELIAAAAEVCGADAIEVIE
jgi:DNA polymerase-3 subunit alpha